MRKVFLKIAKKIFTIPLIGNKIKRTAKFILNFLNSILLFFKRILIIIFKLPRFFFQTLKIIIALIRFNQADKNKIKIILHKVFKRMYYLPFFERYFTLIEEFINDKFALRKEFDNILISTPIALREYKRELIYLNNEINKLKAEKEFINNQD